VGNVGQYTSLVLDEDDFPVISFYDVTNQDLRLVSYSTGTVVPSNDNVIYVPLVLR
jgi:hypothetical protein